MCLSSREIQMSQGMEANVGNCIHRKHLQEAFQTHCVVRNLRSIKYRYVTSSGEGNRLLSGSLHMGD